MIRIYEDKDLYNAVRQQNKLLAVFISVTVFFGAGVIALIVGYTQLPYGDPNAVWLIVATSVFAAAYIIFAFPFMGISYKRCHAYVKMLRFVAVGLKESSVVPFAGIEDWTTHDGVDVNVATFRVHNYKRDEDMLRQVYVDGEKDFPPFEEGQSVHIVTQGNLLVEYEIIG